MAKQLTACGFLAGKSRYTKDKTTFIKYLVLVPDDLEVGVLPENPDLTMAIFEDDGQPGHDIDGAFLAPVELAGTMGSYFDKASGKTLKTERYHSIRLLPQDSPAPAKSK